MDATTREPLMLAYMNAESLRRTLEIGEAVYWSRSRQEFWHKGATSGHIQRIVEIRTDCDQDALILLVEQIGAGACHTGRESCFYRKVLARKRVEAPNSSGSARANPSIRRRFTENTDFWSISRLQLPDASASSPAPRAKAPRRSGANQRTFFRQGGPHDHH
jgi:phosphoribosyl-AMP cyclohydrolase